jgi:hypothetical protein
LPAEKVHRQPKRQWVAGIAGLALVTLTLNWLLLAALNLQRNGTKNVAS